MSLVLERPASAVVAESFAFAPGARDALPEFQGRCTVVRLATIDNEVLGVPRWATLAEAWADPVAPARRRWSENPVVTVGPADDPDLVLATLTPVIVFGVDNEAHGYARGGHRRRASILRLGSGGRHGSAAHRSPLRGHRHLRLRPLSRRRAARPAAAFGVSRRARPDGRAQSAQETPRLDWSACWAAPRNGCSRATFA